MYSLAAPLNFPGNVPQHRGDFVEVVPATLFRGGQWYAAVELLRNGSPVGNVSDDRPQPTVRLAFRLAQQLAELLRMDRVAP